MVALKHFNNKVNNDYFKLSLFSQDSKLSRTRHCPIFSSAVTTVFHEYGNDILFFQHSKTPIYNPFLVLL